MLDFKNGNIIEIQHSHRTNIYVVDVDNNSFYDLYHRHSGYDGGFSISSFDENLVHRYKPNVKVIKYAKTNWLDVLQILSGKKEIKWDYER